MNHSEPPHLPTGARRALHGLILLVLATLILSQAHGVPSIRVLQEGEIVIGPLPNRPYLPAIGPAPLRFAAEPLPRAPRPVAETTALPAAVTLPLEETPLDVAPAPSDTVTDAGPTPEHADPTSAREPARILLDDVRPQVRPEEFLPYFQVPRSKHPGELTIMAPVPPAPPAPAANRPSSATYTQSPQ